MSILRIQFNDDLDNLSVPNKSAFTITDTSTNSLSISSITISGRQLEIEVTPFIQPGAVTVAYDKPTNKPISDRIGNRLDSFSMDFMVYEDKPKLLTFTINGDRLVLTYDEALDTGSVPVIAAYTVVKETFS